MRQLRGAGTVLAGLCAAALAVSLPACGPGTTRPAAAATAPAAAAGGGQAVPAGRHGRAAARTARILRRALGDPDAVAAAGTHVWVANSAYEFGGRGSVTEINAATGALIRVIAGRGYGLTDPRALAVDGNSVWVADGQGDALTEIDAATGALIRVIAGGRYQFADPEAVAADGAGVWVANGGRDSVTEINAATGALIRVIAGRSYQLGTTVYPPAIAAAGNRVWVLAGSSDSVTEINAATGALIRVIAGRSYQLNGPDEIAVAGGRVWVTDVNSASVTELSAATGALIRVIAHLPNVPFAIAADGAGVWVVTNLGAKAVDGARPDGSVAELSASTGRLVRNFTGLPVRYGSPGGAIAADGAGVWVTGTDFYTYRGWAAELSAATGALIRVAGGQSASGTFSGTRGGDGAGFPAGRRGHDERARDPV